MLQPQYITLKIPELLTVSDNMLSDMQKLNPAILITPGNTNEIVITEKDFSFDDIDFLEILTPESVVISEEIFEELCQINDNIKIELNPDSKIILTMLTPELIAAFTLLIGTTLVIWNRRVKKGRAFDATARFDLSDGEITKHRAPDVSYVAFEKATKEFLAENKFIKIAPTFCIEIVSSKYGLKQNLRRMQDDWMAAGTEVGLVVCPYREKYYLFEKDIKNYQEFNFYVPFVHDILKGLSVNFGELLDEAKE